MNAPSVVVLSLNPCPVSRLWCWSSWGLGAANGGNSPFILKEPYEGANLQADAFLHPLSRMAVKRKELWAPSTTSASFSRAQGQMLTRGASRLLGLGCQCTEMYGGKECRRVGDGEGQ